VYASGVPRLWNDTIDAHRRSVRDATLDATAALVAEFGLPGITMSRIAERTGIGRATLYKYFPDVDSILVAWHERLVGGHVAHLVQVRDTATDPAERLAGVLHAYAGHVTGHGGAGDLAALLHRGDHVVRARDDLHGLVRDLIADAAAAGAVRDDVPPDELASFCLRALTAAADAESDGDRHAAVGRLVAVTLAGLRG
jgi:AcrR family transcriptional regulator